MYSTFYLFLSLLVISLCYGRAFNQADRYEVPRLVKNALRFKLPLCTPVENCYGHFRHHCTELQYPYCGPCWTDYKEIDGKCIRKEKIFEPDGNIERIAKGFYKAVPVKDSVVEKDVQDNSIPQEEPKENEKQGGNKPTVNTTTPKTVVHPHPSAPSHVKQGPPGQSSAPGTGNGFLFIVMVAGCSLAGLVGLILAGVCWYKVRKSSKAASEVDYPAYGVTGPQGREHAISPGDRKLAQSAQMYHYQHQKQQMIAMEKANGDMKHDGSEEESDEENEEGDYTVYECPGLAPTGEMEVKNPLFSEDVTPTPGDKDKEKGNE